MSPEEAEEMGDHYLTGVKEVVTQYIDLLTLVDKIVPSSDPDLVKFPKMVLRMTERLLALREKEKVDLKSGSDR